ncbi:uncharacterized protein LOC130803965 isoform X3 [Amaranthus tricolor]|uniref:uncharacterized protein LOC130803965 isoform X3 n=1 Tax=Amaranthus tricolor TaxID=29722 RepID=UPI002590C3EB|nr:uncharacterized protein LOC130803965 isoform X3 [Amaranthus tricolor]
MSLLRPPGLLPGWIGGLLDRITIIPIMVQLVLVIIPPTGLISGNGLLLQLILLHGSSGRGAILRIINLKLPRNSESGSGMKTQNNNYQNNGGGGGGMKGLGSPEREKKSGGAHNHHENTMINGGGKTTSSETKGGGSSSGGGSDVVWPPKFVIALTNKEKEEDFMAIKGSKLPQRPKKRAKFIQRNLNLVSPGGWLCDLTLERYEVREKKISKKRPRGLKAMGNYMESDSE